MKDILFLKLYKKHQNKKKDFHILFGWINSKKIYFLLKFKFNTIIIKIHPVFFEEHDKHSLKCMWNNRDLGVEKSIIKEKKGTFYILHIQIKRYVLFEHIRLDTYVKLGKQK